MAGKNGKEQTKERSDLYEEGKQLWVRVNLYLIRSMYKYIKKAPNLPRTTFAVEGVNMSRQKISRINNGSGFQLTQDDTERIVKTFKIDRKYFEKSSKEHFEIPDVSDDDWKKFFFGKYGASFNDEVIDESKVVLYKGAERIFEELERYQTIKLNKQKKAKEEGKKADTTREDKQISFYKGEITYKMTEKLKQVAKNWDEILDMNDPLYKICHYFYYGEPLRGVDEISLLMKCLEETNCKDWKGENINTLRKYQTLLKKHYEYVNDLIIVH